MRALAAVVVPWLIWGVLDAGIYVALGAVAPDRFPAGGAPTAAGALVLLLLLRAGYSFLAGNVAGRLAPAGRRTVPVAVGLLLLTGLVVQFMQWDLYPVWYHVVFLISIVPLALAGAARARPSTAG